MIRLAKGAWVLVADGEKALVLRNDGSAVAPRLSVVRVDEVENPPMRERGSDRAGRMADSGPGQRSALEAADWHRMAKTAFAGDMARMLLRNARAGAYERLAIAAPPRILGELRAQMDADVKAALIAEIDKDLTNLPVTKIAARLEAEFAALNR